MTTKNDSENIQIANINENIEENEKKSVKMIDMILLAEQYLAKNQISLSPGLLNNVTRTEVDKFDTYPKEQYKIKPLLKTKSKVS